MAFFSQKRNAPPPRLESGRYRILYSLRAFLYKVAMNSALRYFLCGMAMGAADVVPGVSGGTIAFISGIYSRLLQAIVAFDYDFFRLALRFRLREACARIPWDFLLPLLGGIALSIFSLARGVTHALQTWPAQVWSFFFGLVLASVFLLGRELRPGRASTWLALGAGGIAGWLVGGADGMAVGQSLPVFFISGFIAICAMLLPGISGAFILLLLGQYAPVMRAVAGPDFVILAVFALGCVCGIMLFARALNRLLRLYPNAVMAFLTGLMAGSLRTVWPWRVDAAPALPPGLDAETGTAALLCLAGMAVPVLLAFMAVRAAACAPACAPSRGPER